MIYLRIFIILSCMVICLSKKYCLLLWTFQVCFDILSQQEINHDNLFPYGKPKKPSEILIRESYATSYNSALKSPYWVYETLKPENFIGSAKRKKKFTTDKDVEPFNAFSSDFSGSGYSRGHMATSSNHKFSQKAMDETFLLTNIVAQNMQNNPIYWNLIEFYTRLLVEKYKEVSVFSGPLYMPERENFKYVVQYELIGKNRIGVPTHLYKIIIIKRPKMKPLIGSFIVPNKPINETIELKTFRQKLNTIECHLGIKLLPKLKNYDNLCSIEECRLLSIKDTNRFRNILLTDNVEKLEKLWKKFELKSEYTDNLLKTIYKNKLEQLRQVRLIHFFFFFFYLKYNFKLITYDYVTELKWKDH